MIASTRNCTARAHRGRAQAMSAIEETLTTDGPGDEEPTGSKVQLIPQRELLGRIWYLLAFTVGINVFNMLEANIMLPFLYTRVSCCQEGEEPLSTHYDVTDPEVKQSRCWQHRLPIE